MLLLEGSLAPGQNPVCYLSGPIHRQLYRLCMESLMGESCRSPMHTLAQVCIVISGGNCCQEFSPPNLSPPSRLLAGHAHMHFCIPSPGASILIPLYWEALREALFTSPYGVGRALTETLFSSLTLLFYS